MLNENHYKQGLITKIKQKYFKKGNFVLSSGTESDYYIDLSNITLTQDISIILDLILSKINISDYDVVTGPLYGAIPMANGLVLKGLPRCFYLRDKPKKSGQITEGHINENDRVLIVEDVTTSGASILKLAKIVRNLGGIVENAITVVDRQGNSTQFLKENGINLQSLVLVKELGVSPK